jgi:GT2 family glycosyltransferase
MQSKPKSPAEAQVSPRTILKDITLVIPTLGRAILGECLYWIVVGSNWPGGVIVVDQGSNQRVAAWVGQLQAQGIRAEHVLSSQRGRAAGLNRGLERVQTRFVAVTDDDCFVTVDWLRNMIARLHDHPRAVVSGRVTSVGDEEVTMTVNSSKPSVYRRPRLKFDTMSGGNMGTSMAVIERVGFFDEDSCLATAEDTEWIYRAFRAGVYLVYAPEVSVAHYGWRDATQQAAQYRTYARSHGGFYGKYLRKGDWFISIRVVIHHLRAFRRWMRGVITGNRESVLMGRAYLTGLFPGIIAGMRERK